MLAKFFKLTLAFTLLGLWTTPKLYAQPYKGRMGVEAGGDAFVDIVKSSYRWGKPDGKGGWTDLKSGDTDKDGWPKSDCQWVQDWRPATEWFGSIDDPEGYRVDRSGVYKGSFIGQAILTNKEGPYTITNKVYDAATNTTNFDLTIGPSGPNHGLIVMTFTETKHTPSDPVGSGISEFKLLRPGYPVGTTQVFTNEYLKCLTSAAFSTIRFMAVTNTNGNVTWTATGTGTQHWADRKKISYASTGGMDPLGVQDGWPWEYVIDLCNQVGMDMWINIPMSVDDDYIHQLAVLIKEKLHADLNINIEHSNEVWNFGFIQYAWNKTRAKEEMTAGGANYGYDKSTDEELWGQRRHAKRVKDAVDIFGSVMGADQINKRIRGILAGVTPDPQGFFVAGRCASMLEYLKANYGDPKNYIYAISMPIYYGGEAASGSDATAGYSVDQILDAMQKGSDDQRADRLKMVQLADIYNLIGGFVAYEGGPDIGGGGTINLANRIKAIRTSRQKDIYKKNFADNFWDLGGNLAMQFTLEGGYSRYGAWGLTDDVNNPDRNFLFAEVRDLIGKSNASSIIPYRLNSFESSTTKSGVKWNLVGSRFLLPFSGSGFEADVKWVNPLGQERSSVQNQK